MQFYTKHRRIVRWLSILLLVALIVTACSSYKPYQPRNDREEGPEQGLFTGSEGEWVIVGKKKSDIEKEKKEKEEEPDESTDKKQQ